MATWTEIKTVRLAIHDPSQVIDLETVATLAVWPTLPKRQTAYRVEATEAYMIGEWLEPTVLSGYAELELQLSDARITDWIDEHGVADARCYALRDITRTLWAEASLVRTQTGAESSEFNTLLDVYKFYKGLAADCHAEVRTDAANSTGKLFTTSQSEIAGGNL